MQVSDIAIATHDEVWQLEDPDGFVALHRSRQQRTFGGIRIKDYQDTGEALRDVLRLSESMTRKCAINGIPGGGAKAVLVASSIRDRERAITALGQFVEHLKGRFVTGPDLGFTAADLSTLQQHTTHAVQADLSPAAAQGVHAALLGALDATGETLSGKTVAIQGLGAVGARLAALLHGCGVRLLVADLDPARCERAEREWGARTVASADIATVAADVFAPCAEGDVVTEATVATLGARLICGSANNVLDHDGTAERLQQRDILYVPDFLASSGATVAGAWSVISGPGDHGDRVLGIRSRTRHIVEHARRTGETPLAVALDLIREWV